MNIGDNTNNKKDAKKETKPEVSEEKAKYTPKKYPRAWEIGKKLAEDRGHFQLFNQGKKIK